jgi:hypothetical protein
MFVYSSRRRYRFFYLLIEVRFSFVHEPYGARRPEFAINLRVLALEALLTQIDLVLHADIGSFMFRMVDAFSHAAFLLNKMTAMTAG